MRVDGTCQCSPCERENEKEHGPGGPAGCYKGAVDVKGQDATGKVMAGYSQGLGTPQGGSYGSSSWSFPRLCSWPAAHC